jgi:hypothetical protein
VSSTSTSSLSPLPSAPLLKRRGQFASICVPQGLQPAGCYRFDGCFRLALLESRLPGFWVRYLMAV